MPPLADSSTSTSRVASSRLSVLLLALMFCFHKFSLCLCCPPGDEEKLCAVWRLSFYYVWWKLGNHTQLFKTMLMCMEFAVALLVHLLSEFSCWCTLHLFTKLDGLMLYFVAKKVWSKFGLQIFFETNLKPETYVLYILMILQNV